jgi:hypothetical protein
MSTSQPRIPAFASRSTPEGDVYDTDDYYETGHMSYDEQFLHAFLNEITAQGGTHTAQSHFVAPPPNQVPARPGYDTPGNYSNFNNFSNFSHSEHDVMPPWGKNPGDIPDAGNVHRDSRPRTFVVIFEDATGRLFIGARVTRRLVIIFLIVVMLMLLGLQSINGALDLLFNVLF